MYVCMYVYRQICMSDLIISLIISLIMSDLIVSNTTSGCNSRRSQRCHWRRLSRQRSSSGSATAAAAAAASAAAAAGWRYARHRTLPMPVPAALRRSTTPALNWVSGCLSGPDYQQCCYRWCEDPCDPYGGTPNSGRRGHKGTSEQEDVGSG